MGIARARRVIADIERAEEDVRRLAGHTGGVIRLCTQCALRVTTGSGPC